MTGVPVVGLVITALASLALKPEPRDGSSSVLADHDEKDLIVTVVNLVAMHLYQMVAAPLPHADIGLFFSLEPGKPHTHPSQGWSPDRRQLSPHHSRSC